MTALHHHVRAAQRYERWGFHRKAAEEFMCAAEANTGATGKAHFYQSAGINYRCAGLPYVADRAFRSAILCAMQAHDEGEPATQISNIQRDWAMAFYDTGDFDAALGLLEISHDGHKERGEWLEMYASLSFMGRVYAAQGNLEMARRCFDRAHLGLLDSEQPVWSLNNSIHYMKLLGPTPRFFLGLTAMELAVETRHYRRLIETLVLIAPGPKVYGAIKQQFNRLQAAVATF